MVESDSVNVVKWCNGDTIWPWNLNFINSIRRPMANGSDISIVHKSHESNVVADSLAKQGIKRTDDFVARL